MFPGRHVVGDEGGIGNGNCLLKKWTRGGKVVGFGFFDGNMDDGKWELGREVPYLCYVPTPTTTGVLISVPCPDADDDEVENPTFLLFVLGLWVDCLVF
jgi:hypothetical protein